MSQSTNSAPVRKPSEATDDTTTTPAAPDRSRRRRKPSKPKKPRADFPLFAHQNGQWAKKIKGQLHYFGLWSDPEAAHRKYLDEKEDLYAGRKPQSSTDGFTLRDLCNRFLTSKKHKLDAGELFPRNFVDYHEACELVITTFGRNRQVADLRPADFEQLLYALKPQWGPHRRAKVIQCVRSLFHYAMDLELVNKIINFGNFKIPDKNTMRRHRAKVGKRVFEPAELRQVIDAAGVQLRAMLLLGINCGFGNNDVATLPRAALDLERGWVDFPRPKTGIARRVPLWGQTVTVLRAALAKRPMPKAEAHADLVFVTKYGGPWGTVGFAEKEDGKVKVVANDPVAKETTKRLKTLGLRRPGLSFYTLRHVFETIGGEMRDQVAVDRIMGHADTGIAATCREHVADERLRAVVEHVRQWLYGGVIK